MFGLFLNCKKNKKNLNLFEVLSHLLESRWYFSLVNYRFLIFLESVSLIFPVLIEKLLWYFSWLLLRSIALPLSIRLNSFLDLIYSHCILTINLIWNFFSGFYPCLVTWFILNSILMKEKNKLNRNLSFNYLMKEKNKFDRNLS